MTAAGRLFSIEWLFKFWKNTFCFKSELAELTVSVIKKKLPDEAIEYLLNSFLLHTSEAIYNPIPGKWFYES